MGWLTLTAGFVLGVVVTVVALVATGWLVGELDKERR